MKYEKTQQELNQLVADLSQFAASIHQVHWYLKGHNFLFLHPLMDEYMDEVNEQLDVIAERLITLGGSPYSTLSEFAKYTKLPDYPANYEVSVNDRLAQVLAGYRYIEESYKKGCEIASEEGDAVTEDIFTGFLGDVEKKIWMLESELA